MKHRKRSRYTIHILMSLLLVFCLFVAGCKKKEPDPEPTDTSSQTTSESTEPTVSESSSQSPSESTEPDTEPSSEGTTEQASEDKPSGGGDQSVLLTKEDAESLIGEKINTDIYMVELVTEALQVSGREYYRFSVSSNGSKIEPSLIVDKESGVIYCYTEAGEVKNYSSFPLYNASVDAVCDWNGVFSKYSGDGVLLASIDLGQADTSSFEFTMTASSEESDVSFMGVGRIRGNTAVYSESGYQLDFLMKEDALVITESGVNPFHVTLSGEYKNDELLKDDSSKAITPDEALAVLSSLTTKETGLPADLKEYVIMADEGTVTIKDTDCYSISVYSDLGERMELMGVYNVSVDGKHIFKFDIEKADDVEIYTK